MNIKEHIEAGHYPTDEKGRALVPTRHATTATIALTDGPEGEEIVGWQGDGRQYVTTWGEDGKWSSDPHGNDLDLLPPPPRKVKVTRWAVVHPAGTVLGAHPTYREAVFSVPSKDERYRFIELTGEYEEPWS